MMNDFTNIGQLLNDMEIERDEAIERADALAADLRELRENVLLGLGMTAEDVAAMEDGMMEPSINHLLSGYQELAAEVERLRAALEIIARATKAIADEDVTEETPHILAHDNVFAIHWIGELQTDNAALRAQLEAGEGWRKTKTDPPADQQWVQTRTTSFGTYHAEDGYFHVDGVYGWYESEWRPAPPQE